MPEPDPLRPARLRAGLAVAAAVPGFRVEGEPTYVEAQDAWSVPIRIDIDQPSALVAVSTRWVMLIDVGYPYGRIDVYPAASGGITSTFQHQEPNLALGGPWRTGKLCLDNPYRHRLVASRGNDPVGDPDGRVAWYARRAREWVERAAHGDLVHDDDPFEIPRYISKRERIQLVHDESAASFAAWSGRERSWGRITWYMPPEIGKTLFAARFHGPGGAIVRDGAVVLDPASERTINGIRGIWWLWPEPIVLAPWQAPVTWNELRVAGQQQRVDVDRTLQKIAAATRGEGPVVLMLGYPIRRKWGGPPVEIHWQAVELGKLERGKVRNGFRANEQGWWQQDLATTFNGGALMQYATAENWHPDRLQARGRLPDALCKMKVAIIGCGSLGSILAELLVRAGIRRALLIDSEYLESGNLVRHALTASDIGQHKAPALAAMLRAAAPLVDIESLDEMLPPHPKDVHDLLEDCDIVIDCTASNDVPALLASTWWSVPPLFVSASVGFEAKRTLLYRARAHSFPVDDFHAKLASWLALEEASWAASGERLEGAGCYSPLFPARIDDVTMAAIATVRFIEQAATAADVPTELIVLERSGLAGLTTATVPAADAHASAV